MIESLLTSLFNAHLGPYVENLDGSQLRLKLFSGKLSLTNVTVRPDALARLLDLPLRVVAGTIGSITVELPLRSLRSKPIVLLLDEVYILAAPDFAGRPFPHDRLAATRAKLRSLADIDRHYMATQARSHARARARAQQGQGQGQGQPPPRPRRPCSRASWPRPSPTCRCA